MLPQADFSKKSATISRASYDSEGEDEKSESEAEVEKDEAFEYEDSPDVEDEDEPMSEEEDDDDPSFGEKKKKKKKAPKVKIEKTPRTSGPTKLKKRESHRIRRNGTCWPADGPASAAFPSRIERSASSDEDYGSKSHKKKFHARNSGSGRATPEFSHDSDAAWKRGAAKKVVTYDEAQVDYGLESEGDDEAYAQAEGGPAGYGGEVEEIDQVLSHSRDEDRLNDPRDIPQENLVRHVFQSQSPSADLQRFHVKWKGYSHIHNTDELYSFLKTFKGFKRVENYINKVWLVDQRIHGKDPEADWKPTREEVEQHLIEQERKKEMHESYKVVERILDEKEERNDAGQVVSLFFCKWTSKSGPEAVARNFVPDRR